MKMEMRLNEKPEPSLNLNAGIVELTLQNLSLVGGGPQVINDGVGLVEVRELSASELATVSGGPQIINDDVLPP